MSDAVRAALAELMRVIEAAGLPHLAEGVQVGRVAWYVSATGAMIAARVALAAQPAEPVASDPDSWEANAQHLLDRCPYTVWQRPGAGPADLKASLVVTFQGMQMRLDGHPMYAAPPAPQPAADKLPCGHPAELLIRSAETGDPLYCELCDDKAGRRDAERCEQELSAELAALRQEIEYLRRYGNKDCTAMADEALRAARTGGQ